MGHVVNPVSLRLGNSRYWNSIWCLSNVKNYSHLSNQDFIIQQLVVGFFKQLLVKKGKFKYLLSDIRLLRKYKGLFLIINLYDSVQEFSLKKDMFRWIRCVIFRWVIWSRSLRYRWATRKWMRVAYNFRRTFTRKLSSKFFRLKYLFPERFNLIICKLKSVILTFKSYFKKRYIPKLVSISFSSNISNNLHKVRLAFFKYKLKNIFNLINLNSKDIRCMKNYFFLLNLAKNILSCGMFRKRISYFSWINFRWNVRKKHYSFLNNNTNRVRYVKQFRYLCLNFNRLKNSSIKKPKSILKGSKNVKLGGVSRVLLKKKLKFNAMWSVNPRFCYRYFSKLTFDIKKSYSGINLNEKIDENKFFRPTIWLCKLRFLSSNNFNYYNKILLCSKKKTMGLSFKKFEFFFIKLKNYLGQNLVSYDRFLLGRYFIKKNYGSSLNVSFDKKKIYLGDAFNVRTVRVNNLKDKIFKEFMLDRGKICRLETLFIKDLNKFKRRLFKKKLGDWLSFRFKCNISRTYSDNSLTNVVFSSLKSPVNILLFRRPLRFRGWKKYSKKKSHLKKRLVRRFIYHWLSILEAVRNKKKKYSFLNLPRRTRMAVLDSRRARWYLPSIRHNRFLLNKNKRFKNSQNKKFVKGRKNKNLASIRYFNKKLMLSNKRFKLFFKNKVFIKNVLFGISSLKRSACGSLPGSFIKCLKFKSFLGLNKKSHNFFSFRDLIFDHHFVSNFYLKHKKNKIYQLLYNQLLKKKIVLLRKSQFKKFYDSSSFIGRKHSLRFLSYLFIRFKLKGLGSSMLNDINLLKRKFSFFFKNFKFLKYSNLSLYSCIKRRLKKNRLHIIKNGYKHLVRFNNNNKFIKGKKDVGASRVASNSRNSKRSLVDSNFLKKRKFSRRWANSTRVLKRKPRFRPVFFLSLHKVYYYRFLFLRFLVYKYRSFIKSFWYNIKACLAGLLIPYLPTIKPSNIFVVGVTKITLTANFISMFITYHLEQKFYMFQILRAVKRALGRMLKKRVLYGYKIKFSGRFRRSEKAVYLSHHVGNLGRYDVARKLDYSFSSARMKLGLTGVKVWLSFSNNIDQFVSSRNILYNISTTRIFNLQNGTGLKIKLPVYYFKTSGSRVALKRKKWGYSGFAKNKLRNIYFSERLARNFVNKYSYIY